VASWCLQRSIIAVDDDSVGCKYEVMMEVFDYFEKFSTSLLRMIGVQASYHAGTGSNIDIYIYNIYFFFYFFFFFLSVPSHQSGGIHIGNHV